MKDTLPRRNSTTAPIWPLGTFICFTPERSLATLSLRRSPAIAILFAMFSDVVLDHFKNPRNAGSLADASAAISVSNPVCGDVLELSVRVDQGRIAAARFLCRGCVASIACASLLTELLAGHSLSDARSITAESLSAQLGGLPPASFHAAQLAADALAQLIARVATA